MSKPILNYDEQAARIRVLEKALVALDKDYEKLLKEQGTTVDEAWQKYCEVKLDYWKLVEEVRENSGWEK